MDSHHKKGQLRFKIRIGLALCFSNKLRCGLISQSYFFVFVLVKGGEFHLDFWILLVSKMVISKLSGNTVRSTHQSFRKLFDLLWLFTENWIELTQNSTLELNYVQFDAKIEQFGHTWSLKLHKEVYYGLENFEGSSKQI